MLNEVFALDLVQEAATLRVGFRIVCEACGSLQIKLADPAKLNPEYMVHCGRCDADRGTLAELHDLARSNTKTVFEI